MEELRDEKNEIIIDGDYEVKIEQLIQGMKELKTNQSQGNTDNESKKNKVKENTDLMDKNEIELDSIATQIEIVERSKQAMEESDHQNLEERIVYLQNQQEEKMVQNRELVEENKHLEYEISKSEELKNTKEKLLEALNGQKEILEEIKEKRIQKFNETQSKLEKEIGSMEHEIYLDNLLMSQANYTVEQLEDFEARKKIVANKQVEYTNNEEMRDQITNVGEVETRIQETQKIINRIASLNMDTIEQEHIPAVEDMQNEAAQVEIEEVEEPIIEKESIEEQEDNSDELDDVGVDYETIMDAQREEMAYKLEDIMYQEEDTAEVDKNEEVEAQKKAEVEAQKNEEVEAQKKAEAEAQKKAEVEAQKNEEVEAQKKAEAEAQKKAEAEAQKKAEAEAQKNEEAEAQKKAEAEAQKKAEAEAQKKAEADNKTYSETEVIVKPLENEIEIRLKGEENPIKLYNVQDALQRDDLLTDGIYDGFTRKNADKTVLDAFSKLSPEVGNNLRKTYLNAFENRAEKTKDMFKLSYEVAGKAINKQEQKAVAKVKKYAKTANKMQIAEVDLGPSIWEKFTQLFNSHKIKAIESAKEVKTAINDKVKDGKDRMAEKTKNVSVHSITDKMHLPKKKQPFVRKEYEQDDLDKSTEEELEKIHKKEAEEARREALVGNSQRVEINHKTTMEHVEGEVLPKGYLPEAEEKKESIVDGHIVEER